MADASMKGRINRRSQNVGSSNGCSTLSDEEVKRIRDLRLLGLKLQSIADQFGISKAHVSNLVRNKRRQQPTPHLEAP